MVKLDLPASDRKEGLLQIALTQQWCTPHGAQFDGERLFLVAWEVMSPSWNINDSGGKFNEPSADFLFLDREGGVVIGELKCQIRGPAECWRALCQVSHCSVCFAKSFTPQKLQAAYEWCRSGKDGAIAYCGSCLTKLGEAHRQFFDRQTVVDFSASPMWRTMVLATSFSDDWHRVKAVFNSDSRNKVISALGDSYELASKANTKMRLWCELPDVESPERSAVTSYEVEDRRPQELWSTCTHCNRSV